MVYAGKRRFTVWPIGAQSEFRKTELANSARPNLERGWLRAACSRKRLRLSLRPEASVSRMLRFHGVEGTLETIAKRRFVGVSKANGFQDSALAWSVRHVVGPPDGWWPALPKGRRAVRIMRRWVSMLVP